MKMHTTATTVILLATILGTVVRAEPPAERTVVQAVADADQDRILVRWIQLEGEERRFSHHHVLRREAGSGSFVLLTPEPVGAMDTVAAIEALFGQPDYADAFADIQQTYGAGYATELLALGGAELSDVQRLQRGFLPDRNYGAAIALGLGFMDDTVVQGTTYVYEVWGADALGFRQERLGKASATAGAGDPLPAPSRVECVDLGDARGDMRSLLRWDEPLETENRYVVGYDLYRVPADAAGHCTAPNGPGAPGSVKVNPFPAQRVSSGRVGDGRALFASSCASCHTAGSPRDEPPPAGVRGGNIDSFRRLMFPELVPTAHHDTPALAALSPESVRAVFDWIHEFHYHDDGATTPANPIVEGETYCYRVLARDLLGQHGASLPVDRDCTVLDRDPAQTPWGIQVQEVAVGQTHEICEVSWQRNAGAGDDTVDYLLFRMANRAPYVGSDPALRTMPPDPAQDPALAIVSQPPAGERVVYADTSLAPDNAGQRFFYGVASRDDAGNISGFSGWAPCVPRDIVAPARPVVAVQCCDEGVEGCEDKSQDPDWVAAGGMDVVMWDPRAQNTCPDGVRISATTPDDTFGSRLFRSFDDETYLAGKDFENETHEDFSPLIDSPVFVNVKGFDASGNFSAPSDNAFWIVWGLPLPAPQIYSLAQLQGPLEGYVQIRFRSLPWNNLLGFALYKHNIEADEDIPADIGELVIRFQDGNLSTYQVSNGQWAVLPGAQSLADVPIPVTDPGGPSFLYFDIVDQSYVMQAYVGDTDGLVLNLVAIGWSGREGYFQPYLQQGIPHDGVLDWPQFRATNPLSFELINDLQVSYSGPTQSMVLTWTDPYNCVDDDVQPFTIFRRRGGAQRWEQITPPFQCDGTNPTLQYLDDDVEPLADGSPRLYEYVVVRLQRSGEFKVMYGPKGATAP